MKNFDIVRENVLSFHVGVVKYQNKYYSVVRDSMVNNTPTADFRKVDINPDGTYTIFQHRPDPDDVLDIPEAYKPTQILKEAIYELLDYDSDKALTKVRYIRRIIEELKEFQKDAGSTVDAFSKFYDACIQNMINYHGPLPADFNRLEITQNFIDDLCEEIAIRLDVIIDIESALEKAFKGTKPPAKPLVWFDESRYNRAIDNTLLPGELNTTVWENINHTISVSDPDEKEIAISVDSNKQKIIHKADNLDDPVKKEGEIPYDFKFEVLNERGRKIYDNLIKCYSGQQPKRLVFMIRALSDLELVDLDFTSASNTAKWARTFDQYFGNSEHKYIPKTIYEAIKRTRGTLHEEYNNQIRKEMILIRGICDDSKF